MRQRLTRWGKWAGLALSLLLVAAFALSTRWALIATGGSSIRVWLAGGGVGLMSGQTDLTPPWSVRIARSAAELVWCPRSSYGTSTWMGVLPLWWFCAAAMLPTAALWWLDRRRRRGGCSGCGYNLDGLPAVAPCPECGDGAQP